MSTAEDIRDRALEEGLGIVIDIRTWDRPLFYAALPGSTASNPNWARRKINVVRMFLKSTYRMVLEQQRAERTFQVGEGLPVRPAVGGGAGRGRRELKHCGGVARGDGVVHELFRAGRAAFPQRVHHRRRRRERDGAAAAGVRRARPGRLLQQPVAVGRPRRRRGTHCRRDLDAPLPRADLTSPADRGNICDRVRVTPHGMSPLPLRGDSLDESTGLRLEPDFAAA